MLSWQHRPRFRLMSGRRGSGFPGDPSRNIPLNGSGNKHVCAKARSAQSRLPPFSLQTVLDDAANLRHGEALFKSQRGFEFVVIHYCPSSSSSSTFIADCPVKKPDTRIGSQVSVNRPF